MVEVDADDCSFIYYKSTVKAGSTLELLSADNFSVLDAFRTSEVLVDTLPFCIEQLLSYTMSNLHRFYNADGIFLPSHRTG